MSDAGAFSDAVLGWQGGDDDPARWATENAQAIRDEALGGQVGPIADALDQLSELAESHKDVAAWGLAARSFAKSRWDAE